MEIVNRKKILFLVTQSEFGGAQRYIYEVARNLDRVQYEILVGAGQGDGELLKKLKDVQTQAIELKQMKRTLWPWQVFLAVKEINQLLKKEKPDVLFLCSTTAGLLGSLARISYKVKTVYRIGGWAFRDPRAFWKNWLILLAEKLTSPLKDKIVVNSEIDLKLAIKYRIAPAQKLVKIYNGIDVDSLNFLSKNEALKMIKSDAENKVIGTVANFYKTKGLKYLIEAAKTVNAQFIIIGEGSQRPELESLIKKYRLENKVFLVGRIPDAYRYLKAFDVFVLPSLKEGFPWIILEAVAAEIPVVSTNVGAIPEIIDKEFLVEPKNSETLAKKISWMLEHPAKVKLKQEFTSRIMLRKTDQLLRELY